MTVNNDGAIVKVNNDQGIVTSVVTSFIETVIRQRGLQYANVAPENFPGLVYKGGVSAKGFAQTRSGVATITLAVVAIVSYVTFRHLASKGETQAMPARAYKEMVLTYTDGTKKTRKIEGPYTIEGEELRELKDCEIRTVSAVESHVKNIDQLTTREQVVAWLITYQHLTGDGNGKDVIRGTAGAGLATVLRGAMFGEALNILDNTATVAIVDTLKELRTNGELPILNSTDLADTRRLQEVETRQHRARASTYDAFGRAMSGLSPNFRANIAWMASGIQGLPKAILGLTNSG